MSTHDNSLSKLSHYTQTTPTIFLIQLWLNSTLNSGSTLSSISFYSSFAVTHLATVRLKCSTPNTYICTSLSHLGIILNSHAEHISSPTDTNMSVWNTIAYENRKFHNIVYQTKLNLLPAVIYYRLRPTGTIICLFLCEIIFLYWSLCANSMCIVLIQCCRI